MSWPILRMLIEVEADIVAVRQRARHLAELLGSARQDQTRLATAVSEIARNAFSYGRGGWVEFLLEEHRPQMLLIRVTDKGPGIADLDAILEGRYRSSLGMGLGIAGARRLVDRFDIQTGPDGTRVEIGQYLPAPSIITREKLESIVSRMAQSHSTDPLTVLREQNLELMQSLDELRRKQDEAVELNRELGDTNRGVVALTAELDARAEQLREASETKTRFLSNMSHEFRTPLNSIMALSRLLLDRVDGELTDEQSRQIGYIRRSAGELLDLVNDLLDLAKVEAGRIDLKPTVFTIADMFGGLRGALRPLREESQVALIFESAADLPELCTDESKLTQILRNFLSNALKFTESGEIHVSAHYDSRTRQVTFAVADTGVGIASEDQERIFEEFAQVDSKLQKQTKGTGLGLPLSRKLAELMGGEIWVESEPGKGSTFYLSIPAELKSRDAAGLHPTTILLADDDETFRYVLRQILAQEPNCVVLEAGDGQQALGMLRQDPPDVLFLDLQMPLLSGDEVLAQMSEAMKARTRVIVSTSLAPDLVRERIPAGIPVMGKHAVSRDSVRALLRTIVNRGG